MEFFVGLAVGLALWLVDKLWTAATRQPDWQSFADVRKRWWQR